MVNMKILITGAQGMLGSELVKLASQQGNEVIALDRGALDITDSDSVDRMIELKRPEVVVNCAAYNLVDLAETPEGKIAAERINVDGPTNLAKATARFSIPLVHVSTDYVFAGDKQEGYKEDDEPNPLSSVYSKSKLRGEKVVESINSDSYIVRISKLFGVNGESPNVKKSFVELMLNLANTKPELNVVDEQEERPVYAPDLAAAILELIEKKYPFGIYHLVNSGEPVTPYAWAMEIFAAAGISPKVNKVKGDFFPAAAPRPLFSALVNTKFPPLRDRIEALTEFLQTLEKR